MSDPIQFTAALLSFATVFGLIVPQVRRLRLVPLALVYAVMLVFTWQPLGGGVAAARFVGGVVALAVLALSARPGSRRPVSSELSGRPAFRGLAAAFVSVVCWGVSRATGTALPGLTPMAAQAAIVLMGGGLLMIGLFSQPFEFGLGLLTFLVGFEIVYAAIEPSLAVGFLLAAAHLGIALAISLLMQRETETAASEGNA